MPAFKQGENRGLTISTTESREENRIGITYILGEGDK